MGVRGLKTFIENNSQLVSNYHLHDTKIVIDGNNLKYGIYWKSIRGRPDYIYGGDYANYAMCIKQFFHPLLKCGVEPIVIFDGGIDISMLKMKTIIERLKSRVNASSAINKHNLSGEKTLPVLCHIVFLVVLNELRIVYLQSVMEADNHIAMIANHYNCPVMSNDSDFYIYNLTGGYVILDSLEEAMVVRTFENEGVKYKYLDCNYYHISNLLEYFPGVDLEMLPLFSCLMGNDYISQSVFNNVFSAIPSHAINHSKKTALRVSPRYEKMIRLLNWMKDRDLDEAVKFLMRFLKTQRRGKATDLLEFSLHSYSQGNGKSYLMRFLDGSIDAQVCQQWVFEEIGVELPYWYIEQHCRSQISSSAMNVILLKTNIFLTQIDDFSLPSSYFCTGNLQRLFYSLLRLHEDDTRAVKVYDRKDFNLGTFFIEPFRTDELPILFGIEKQSLQERRNIVLNALNSDETHLLQIQLPINIAIKVDESFKLFFVIVKYWINESKVAIWIEFVYALVCMILFQGFVNNENNKKMLLFSKEERDLAKERLAPYLAQPQHNCHLIFQPRPVHFFSEIQALILLVNQIEGLLCWPLPQFKIHNYLNGNFLYNLTTELAKRKDPRLYVAELVGRRSEIAATFNRLLDVTLEGVAHDQLIR